MTNTSGKQYPWTSIPDDELSPLSREQALEGLQINLDPVTGYLVVYECQELKDNGATDSSIIYNEATGLVGESVPPWHTFLLRDADMLRMIESLLRKDHTLVGYFKVDFSSQVELFGQDMQVIKELLEDLLNLGRPSSAILSKLSRQNWV